MHKQFLKDFAAIGAQMKAILVAESFIDLFFEDCRSDLRLGPGISLDYETEVDSGHESAGFIFWVTSDRSGILINWVKSICQP